MTAATAAHWTYAASLADYMSFFRTCGPLQDGEPATAIAYSRELARIRWNTREQDLAELVIPLTEFQANEVNCGLDIDAADHGQVWGQVDKLRHRKTMTWQLVIKPTQEARDRALYRITSSRDILLDNAGDQMSTTHERRTAGARGRSMESLARRLIETAGGLQAFSPDVRRWARY